MLKQWFRVLYSDNGTLTDKSLDVQTGQGFQAPLVQDEDYIYVGQYLPFNNVFMQVDSYVSSSGDVVPELQAEYWADQQWRPVLDVIDDTAGMTKSGVIQFTPDKDYSWTQVQDTGNNLPDGPDELTSVRIYDLYWLRIKATATAIPAKTILKMGYAFCDSPSLKIYEPEIDQYLVPWGGSGKTDWIEQIMAASEQVFLDLKGKQLVTQPGQILRFDDVYLATIYRTLLLIYTPLGEAFKERRSMRLKEYGEALNVKRFTFDMNRTGTVEQGEIANTTGMLVR